MTGLNINSRNILQQSQIIIIFGLSDYKILDYRNIFHKKFYLIIYKQCMYKNIKKIIKNNY